MVANKKANKGKNDKRGYRDGKDKDKDDKEKKPFKSEVKKKWQTKAAKTREKELKEVERDMKEAEAEVDLEERAQVVSLEILAKGTRLMIIANGNTEESLCSLFPHSQESTKDSTPPHCARRYHPFRSLHQYRILPRSPRCPSPYRCRGASTHLDRC